MGDFGAEQFLDPCDRCQRVFDHIVEQTGRDRHVVKPHVSDQRRYFEWMGDKGLARPPFLASMLRGREIECPLQQVDIGVGIGRASLVRQFFKTEHRKFGISSQLQETVQIQPIWRVGGDGTRVPASARRNGHQ
jgi:hypothetical protein